MNVSNATIYLSKTEDAMVCAQKTKSILRPHIQMQTFYWLFLKSRTISLSYGHCTNCKGWSCKHTTWFLIKFTLYVFWQAFWNNNDTSHTNTRVQARSTRKWIVRSCRMALMFAVCQRITWEFVKHNHIQVLVRYCIDLESSHQTKKQTT